MDEENARLPEKLVLFDGVCHFCNRSVLFVQKRDKRKSIFYAPIQGETALAVYPGLNQHNPESILYLRKGRLYQKSTAAIRIAMDLGGVWNIVAVFLLIPGFIRNYVYDLIARNRYRWFGKYDSCMIPAEDQKAQYLP